MSLLRVDPAAIGLGITTMLMTLALIGLFTAPWAIAQHTHEKAERKRNSRAA